MPLQLVLLGFHSQFLIQFLRVELLFVISFYLLKVRRSKMAECEECIKVAVYPQSVSTKANCQIQGYNSRRPTRRG